MHLITAQEVAGLNPAEVTFLIKGMYLYIPFKYYDLNSSIFFISSSFGNNKKYILVLQSKNLEDDIEGAEFLANTSLENYNFL